MSNCFRLHVDPARVDRWYLKAPVTSDGHEVDARLFTKCLEYSGSNELLLPIRKSGRPVSFNFADFDMPVVLDQIGEAILNRTDEVQRVPVQIHGVAEKYEILNVLANVSCIDKRNSEFDVWKEGDGRPDKVGRIRMVTRLRINPCDAYGHSIFRLAEWPIALIVSDEIRSLLQSSNVTGIGFEPMN